MRINIALKNMPVEIGSESSHELVSYEVDKWHLVWSITVHKYPFMDKTGIQR